MRMLFTVLMSVHIRVNGLLVVERVGLRIVLILVAIAVLKAFWVWWCDPLVWWQTHQEWLWWLLLAQAR